MLKLKVYSYYKYVVLKTIHVNKRLRNKACILKYFKGNTNQQRIFNLQSMQYCKSIYLHLVHHKLKSKTIFYIYFIAYVYIYSMCCAICLTKECMPLYTYIYEFKQITLLIINKEETARFVLKRLGNMKHL